MVRAMICMSDSDYIRYIVSSLQLAETCADDAFPAQVELLWSVVGPLSACDRRVALPAHPPTGDQIADGVLRPTN
jgi:hypothetical protein